MNSTHYNLAVKVEPLPGAVIVLAGVPADETFAELMRQLLVRLGVLADEREWVLVFQGQILPLEAQIRLHLPPHRRSDRTGATTGSGRGGRGQGDAGR
jgi:hypothetical protein